MLQRIPCVKDTLKNSFKYTEERFDSDKSDIKIK